MRYLIKGDWKGLVGIILENGVCEERLDRTLQRLQNMGVTNIKVVIE